MVEICAEKVVWNLRLQLHVQRCVLDILRTPFLEVHTVGAKLKKSSIEVGPETP